MASTTSRLCDVTRCFLCSKVSLTASADRLSVTDRGGLHCVYKVIFFPYGRTISCSIIIPDGTPFAGTRYEMTTADIKQMRSCRNFKLKCTKSVVLKTLTLFL